MEVIIIIINTIIIMDPIKMNKIKVGSENKIITENFRNIIEYKDLLYFLVKKDIFTKYSQSILGVGWAIIQPMFNMLVFTLVFGHLAKINSDGVPYSIFSYTALVPWTYFSGSLSSSSNSLVGSSSILKKVYFPRVLIPLAPVFARLIDFTISFTILILMMIYFKFSFNFKFIFIPYLILLMALTASGLGMWTSALSVRYRDVNYSLGFIIQILMYLSPVIYSVNQIPEKYRLIYGIFPMAGVIEGFRSILLSTNQLPYDLILVGSFSSIILFFTGLIYFSNMEKYFSDII